MQPNFVFNSQIQTAEVERIEHIDGREYLIAPVVALVAGVVNGELAPADEIGAYPESWNGIPLTLGHPSAHGQPVSANDPEILATQAIGKFLNAEFVDDKLKGQWWIDIAEAERIGGDAITVMERLEAGEMIETSTGYFRDIQNASGEHEGQEYEGIQRNIRPDHLAILIDEIGACSIADGCGAPRINQRKDKSMFKVIINREISLDERMNQAYTAFYEIRPHSDIWVREVFDNFIIASNGKKLFKFPYTNDDGEVTFDDPVEVEIIYQEVNTEPATNSIIADIVTNVLKKLGINQNKEDNAMPTKCELVKELVANDACPLGEDVLKAASEDELLKLKEALAGNEQQPEPEPQPQPEPEPAPVGLPEEVTAFMETLKGLGGAEGFKQAMERMAANAEQERSTLTAVIRANQSNAFDEETLNGMPLEQLRMLAHSLPGAEDDFMGRGLPVANRQDDGWIYPEQEA